MGRDYIPFRDAEFDGWLARFADYIEAHYAELGLSAADKDSLVAANNSWRTDYRAHIAAKNAARGAKSRKDHTRDTAESLARNLAQRSTVFPGTTNAHRASMGITVPDTKPTPTSLDYIETLEPPMLSLDWSQRGQVAVHFGVNPGNEKWNAKPADIAGAKIWFRIDTGPWQFLADDTNSPYIHTLAISEPVRVEYRAQWFDKRMRAGSFGQTAKCTVTP